MKKYKKMLAFLLSLLLLLGGVPIYGEGEEIALDLRNGPVTITEPGTYRLTSGGETTENSVILDADNGEFILLLDNLKIEKTGSTDKGALILKENSGANVKIVPIGKNSLTSYNGYAALEKNGSGEGVGTLTLSGEGSLACKTYNGGAAIGGSVGKDSVNIVIEKGSYHCMAWSGGAGIGGGYGANGGNITIKGGKIDAVGASSSSSFDNSGSGIGHGRNGQLIGNISILGGNVKVRGLGNKKLHEPPSPYKVTVEGSQCLVKYDGIYTAEVPDFKEGILIDTRKEEGTVKGQVSVPKESVFDGYNVKKVRIPQGSSLTIPEDVTLEMEDQLELIVEGSLRNNGTLKNTGKVTVKNGGTFTNNGKTDLPYILGSTKWQILVEEGGTFLNAPQGEVNFALGNELVNDGVVKNQGTFSRGKTTNNKTFENTGILKELRMENTSTGTFSNKGTIENASSIKNEGTMTNEGEGSLEVAMNSTFTNNGTFQNDGETAIHYTFENKENGTVTNNGTFTLPKRVQKPGDFLNEGTVTNKGTLINEKKVANTGTIINEENAVLDNKGTISNKDGELTNKGTVNNEGSLSNREGTLTNTGTINNKKSISNYNGTITNSGTINNTKTLNNDYGTFNNEGTVENSDTVSNYKGTVTNTGTINNTKTLNNNYGTFNNEGTVENSDTIKNSQGTITNSGTINNTKTLNNDYGTFNNEGTVENSGTIGNKNGTFTTTEEGEITGNYPSNGTTSEDVTFLSATADGKSQEETTTEITLVFNKDVHGLGIDDIAIEGITIDTLTSKGKGIYALEITYDGEDNVTKTVTLKKTKFTFHPQEKTVTLYKAPPKYTLKAAANPLEGGAVTGAGTYTEGETVTLTATAHEGYRFLKWMEGEEVLSTESLYTFSPKNHREITAIFEKIEEEPPVTETCTLTLKGEPSLGGTLKGGGVFDLGTTVTVTAIPEEGYVFTGWAKDGVTVSSSPSYTFSITEDTILEATFEKITVPSGYTITLLGNGGTVSPETLRAEDGIVPDLPIPKRSGYRFKGWFTEKIHGKEVTKGTEIEENLLLYAHWTPASSGGSWASDFWWIGGKSEEPKGNEKISKEKPLPSSAPSLKGSPSTAKGPAKDLPFKDVRPEDWFREDVKYVYDNGYMKGTAEDAFSPNLPITRGMFVTILWRMEKEPLPKATGFPDIPVEKYYHNAALWGGEMGIIKGREDGSFGGDDPLTRQDLVTLLYRYGDWKKRSMNPTGDLSSFKDGLQTRDYAAIPMKWALGEGILKGKGEGTLDPEGTATRAEIAAILHRYLR